MPHLTPHTHLRLPLEFNFIYKKFCVSITHINRNSQQKYNSVLTIHFQTFDERFDYHQIHLHNNSRILSMEWM